MARIIWVSLLIAVAIFIVWIQFYGDDWLTEFNDERQMATTQQISSGRELGANADQQSCFEAGLSQVNTCFSFSCTVDAGNFIKGCWEVASPTANFCDAVPAYQQEITEEEKSWARLSCWDMNKKSEGCRLLMRQKQQLCESVE